MPLRGERYDPTLILRDFVLSWWEQLAEPTAGLWRAELGGNHPHSMWRQRVKRWSDYAIPRIVDVPMAADAVQVAGVQLDDAVNWVDWAEKTRDNPALRGASLRGMDARGWRVTDTRLTPLIAVQRSFGAPVVSDWAACGPVIELDHMEVQDLIRERENIESATGGNGFAFADASLQRCNEYRGVIVHEEPYVPAWSVKEMRELEYRHQLRRAELDEEERRRVRRAEANRREFFDKS